MRPSSLFSFLSVNLTNACMSLALAPSNHALHLFFASSSSLKSKSLDISFFIACQWHPHLSGFKSMFWTGSHSKHVQCVLLFSEEKASAFYKAHAIPAYFQAMDFF